MNTTALLGNRVLRVLFARPVCATGLCMSLLFSPALCFAEGGALSFHGAVVNPGCEVSAVDAKRVGEHVRFLQATPEVTLQVSTVDPNCSAQFVSFSVHYEAIPVISQNDAPTSMVTSRLGLVTLTYQ
ncbi:MULTISPECIES: hypothetical protein [Pseudomonas]|uniref:Type 1 fimbrial protein n=2 Tax=Pseudomonas TaxID=286 RepID=A0AAU8LK79_PSESX|nr:hypothetical protein [Pseudomonas triticifolii]MBC3954657.1 hypothetical protein [Pseudomonas triticifolii]